MKKLLASTSIFALLCSPAVAQQTKTQLNTEINTQLPDNVQGLITPAVLRGVLHDMVNSSVTLADTNTTTGTIIVTPPAGMTPGLNITQSLSGTPTPGFNKANLINITSDTVNNGDGNELAGFAVIQSVGGSTAKGHRAAVHGQTIMTAPGDPAGTAKDMSGGTFQVTSSTGNNLGNFIALSAIGYLTTGATGAATITGIEVNVGMFAGTTTASRFGVLAALTSDNAAQATGNDVAFAILNNTGTATNSWKVGLGFIGLAPVTTGGILIAGDGNAATMATGIDFTGYTFTSSIFNHNNFRIAGNGNVFTAGWLNSVPLAVGSLPTCNGAAEGARMSVNNSNAASYTAGIGAVVAGGGTTHVPVYCDGTNWRIG